MDDITNYKSVLMIVILVKHIWYNSDLINVSEQNVSFMLEIYYLMKNTMIVKKK